MPHRGSIRLRRTLHIVILSVRVNRYGKLTIIGDEKNDRGNEHEIKADDIFAGQMDFITSEIGD